MSLETLTPLQDRFALLLAQGKSQIDAYKEAGYRPATDKIAYERASRLAAQDKVKARLAELRQPAATAAVLTLEGHLTDLHRLRNAAAARGQFSAAISAEMARGKALGFYDRKTPLDVNLRHGGGGPRIIVIGGAEPEEGVDEALEAIRAAEESGADA